MPDAAGLTVKLVVQQATGRVFGEQAVRRRGADKRATCSRRLSMPG